MNVLGSVTIRWSWSLVFSVGRFVYRPPFRRFVNSTYVDCAMIVHTAYRPIRSECMCCDCRDKKYDKTDEKISWEKRYGFTWRGGVRNRKWRIMSENNQIFFSIFILKPVSSVWPDFPTDRNVFRVMHYNGFFWNLNLNFQFNFFRLKLFAIHNRM